MILDDSFGSISTERGLRTLFGAFGGLVDEARLCIKASGDPVLSAIRPLLLAITDSGHSLELLASKGQFRDGFVTSRTIFETAVNVCFILVGAEPVAERAQKHALQKWWRDLEKHMRLVRTEAQRDLSASPPLRPSADMQEALDQFTGNRGREITSWTPENVSQRLDFIAERLGGESVASLRTALVAIYRHSSEIAHGTLYGAFLTAGQTKLKNQPQTPAEFEQFYREYFCMLFLVLIGVLRELLTILSKRRSLDAIIERAEQLLSDFRNTQGLSTNSANHVL
jgi:hypothetical protein